MDSQWVTKPYMPAMYSPLVHELVRNAEAMCEQVLTRADRHGKSWGTRMSREHVVQRCRDIVQGNCPHVQAVILDGTHLMFYSIGAPWFSNEPWLVEQFYMRVARGRSDPLHAVDVLAQDKGCTTTVFGTSLAASDQALGRLLMQRGYRPESSQLIKDYSWE